MSKTTKRTTSPPLPTPIFDLETYISRYAEDSNTRLDRLLFISNNSAIDEETCKQARVLAERQIRSMGNTKAYAELFEITSNMKSSSSSSETTSIMYDTEWVSQTNMKSHQQLETLKARLASSQSHLSKESIRQSYIALSNYYKKHDELQNALRCLLSSRDYCTTNPQIASVCTDIMEVGILWQNYVYVHTYYTKAKHTNDLFTSSSSSTSSSTPNVASACKLEAAEGLALLAEEQYYQSCQKFLDISPEISFPTLLAQEDIVLYIAILALATFNRKELQLHILDNFNFQQRCMEFTYPYVKDALRYFSRADYGKCLSVLDAIKPLLYLDVYLHDHVDTLFQKIVHRCVVTYFQPFSTVSIPKMAHTFQMEMDDMEQLVETLLLSNLDSESGLSSYTDSNNNNNTTKNTASTITNNSFSSSPHEKLRIHSRDGMIRHTSNPSHIQKKILQKNVLFMLRDFQQMTTSMMLRLSCLESDLVVTASDCSDTGDNVRVIDSIGPYGEKPRAEIIDDSNIIVPRDEVMDDV